MQITVSEIAKILGGEVIGDGSALLSKVAKIEEGEPGALSFLANPKYEAHLYDTRSTAVLVNRNFEPAAAISTTLIKVDDAYLAFTKLLEQFANPTGSKTGITKEAVISDQAKTGANVYVGEFTVVREGAVIGDNTKISAQCYIGEDVKIGSNCTIYPHVTIYHGCIIGDNCTIHSGSVIGSDGFGFAPQADRSYKKIPQTGNVIIEDDVDLGAGVCIDRATMGSTIIRKGVKLDNLVQIAHNVEIGEHTVIASQSGVAGSTKVGRYCIFAGQVGIAGHLNIADGSIIGAKSGVSGNIKKPDMKWFGYPITEYGQSLRAHSIIKNLPEMEKRIRELEAIIKELKK